MIPGSAPADGPDVPLAGGAGPGTEAADCAAVHGQAADVAAENVAAGNVAAGNVAAGNVAAGNVAAGNVTAGNGARAGDPRTGDTRRVEADRAAGHGPDLGVDAGRPGPGDLPGDAPAGRTRLPVRTRAYWTVQALAVGIPVTGVVAFWAAASGWFTPGIRWTVAGLTALLMLVVRAAIAPGVRHRLFWYAVSETEIDVQHGFLVTSRTVVPMSRVQFLRSEHGVLADRFALADLHIHTAAGAVSLPGLDRAVAGEVRELISRWAHLDDDV